MIIATGEDIVMRSNAGFEIIASVPIEIGSEVVIGEKKSQSGSQYVCWLCSAGNNYYWGRYASEYKDAVKVMTDRLRTFLARS